MYGETGKDPWSLQRQAMTDGTPQTPIQRETAYLGELNTSLEATLGTLETLAESMATLTDNMANSNRLADIYKDIHLHNRRLNATLQRPDAAGSVESDAVLDEQIATLKARTAALKAQLNTLER